MSCGLKFKVGDRIRVLSSDAVGYNYATILGHVLINNVYNYTVVWDHFHPKSHYYIASEVESDWELVVVDKNTNCPVVKSTYKRVGDQADFTITLPKGLKFVPIEFTLENIKVACDHDWSEYHGFRESYQFCKKCDEKRLL